MGADMSRRQVDVGVTPPGSLPTVWRWCVWLAIRFPLEVVGPLPLSNSLTALADFFLWPFKIQDILLLKVAKFQLLESQPLALWPTTDVPSLHPGKQKAFLGAGEPTRLGCCHSGPGDRGEDSQGLARSHPTIPGTCCTTWSPAALQDKEERFLSAQRSADKCIIN